MRNWHWAGLIAGAGLALAGCAPDPYAPPPGLALSDEPLANSMCRAVAASDPLMAQLREGETMAACPPWVIPGFTSRTENQARLIARAGRWTVYAVPPAPPRRAGDRGRGDATGPSPLLSDLIIGGGALGGGPCGMLREHVCKELARRAAAAAGS